MCFSSRLLEAGCGVRLCLLYKHGVGVVCCVRQGAAWGGDKATTGKHEMATLQFTCHRTNRGTEAEPQQIVAQRLLSCLQYHVPIKSSTEDLTRPTFGNTLK